MKISLLEQTHHDYEGGRYEQLRGLHEGGRRWAALIETWLPQHQQEMTGLYEERKKLATYHNHFGAIIGMLAASLFSEGPIVDGNDTFDEWVKSVDGAGESLGEFFKERFLDALICRRAWVWVNLPAKPEGVEYATLGDEEAAGALDAYLVGLAPESVLDWETDERGNLKWVLFRDIVAERAEVGAKRRPVWRWTYVDAAVIRRWVWESTDETPLPSDDMDAEEQAPVAHNLGRLPIKLLELKADLWAGNRLRDPALAHLRLANDVDWALHRAAHPLLVIFSQWGQEKVPVLGAGYYLQAGQNDKVEYAEPSGAAWAHQLERLRALREDLYRVVQQMSLGADTSASRSKASGESKAYDWKAWDVVLGSYSDAMIDYVTEVLALVAKVRQTDPPEVTGLDDWQEEDITAFLEAAAMSVDAARLSPTFQRVVAKRQARRLLGDEASAEDLAKIEAEIDSAEIVLGLPEYGTGAGDDDDEDDED